MLLEETGLGVQLGARISAFVRDGGMDGIGIGVRNGVAIGWITVAVRVASHRLMGDLAVRVFFPRASRLISGRGVKLQHVKSTNPKIHKNCFFIFYFEIVRNKYSCGSTPINQ